MTHSVDLDKLTTYLNWKANLCSQYAQRPSMNSVSPSTWEDRSHLYATIAEDLSLYPDKFAPDSDVAPHEWEDVILEERRQGAFGALCLFGGVTCIAYAAERVDWRIPLLIIGTGICLLGLLELFYVAPTPPEEGDGA